MKTHYFKASRQVGNIGENQVKTYLEERGHELLKLSIPEEKKRCADFIVVSPGMEKVFDLEIKTEPRAEQTGNFFYETEVAGKPGWCRKYADKGDVVICHVLPISRQFVFYRAKMLSIIEARLDEFYERTIQNSGYVAKGKLVPVDIYKSFGRTIHY